jgi:hypothetical protein
LEFYPHFAFVAFDLGDVYTVLYGSSAITLSLGYLVAAIIVIPMGMVNLDSNVRTVQTTSFVFLIVLFTEFIAYFIYERPQFSGRVAAFGMKP